MEQTIEPTASAVELAEQQFNDSPTAATLKALESAKTADVIAKAQARKAKAEREAKEREQKLARLAELRELLTTKLNAEIDERAQRIAAIVLEQLKPIVDEYLNKTFDEYTAYSFEAQELAEELEQPKPLCTITLNSLSFAASELIRSKMPDGTLDPTYLTKYLGSWWG